MSDRTEATHPATPVRLQQARQDSDATRSHELAAAFQLTGGTIAVWLAAQGMITGLADFSIRSWSPNLNSTSWQPLEFQQQITEAAIGTSIRLLPVLAVLLAIAVAANIVQTGPIAARSIFHPRSLNPMAGFARLFSMGNLSRGILGLPKIAIVLTASGSVIWSRRLEIMNLQQQPLGKLVPGMTNFLFCVATVAAATLLILSLIDYLIERFSRLQRLRMTEQELRDERRMQNPDSGLADRRRHFYQRISEEL